MLTDFVLKISRTHLFQLKPLYRNSWVEEVLIWMLVSVLAFFTKERGYQVDELGILFLCLLILPKQFYSRVLTFLGKHTYLRERNSNVLRL